MSSEKFIVVSLEDEKSKDLANVISNDTSRKILSFLSDHEASESDIVKALSLPASTVNYNIQNLVKSNLIEVKDFYWSGKGNKVNVYTIAKKFIVIAPKGSRVSSAIKSLVPVAVFSLAAAALIHFAYRSSSLFSSEKMLRAPLSESIAPASDSIVPAEGAVIEQFVSSSWFSSLVSSYAFWFLLGSLFAIIICFVIHMFRRKK